MNKQAAVDFFDSPKGLADAVGVTVNAVSQWPDVLPPRIADRVIAAAVRAAREVPSEWLGDTKRLHGDQRPARKAA